MQGERFVWRCELNIRQLVSHVNAELTQTTLLEITDDVLKSRDEHDFNVAERQTSHRAKHPLCFSLEEENPFLIRIREEAFSSSR